MSTLDLYGSIWQYQDLIRFMTSVRRRSSVFKTLLGRIWFLLNPLTQILIYYFLVAIIFNRPGVAGVSPFIMIVTGITHYTFLQQGLANGAGAITGNETLLMQVRLESAVFVAVAYLNTLRNFAIMFAIYGLFFLWMGPDWHVRMLWYPVLLAVLATVVWSGSLLLAVAVVFFRDVKQLITVTMRILLYLSPVIYSLNLVPEAYRGLYLLNPVGCFFALLQWCLLGGEAPPAFAIALLATLTIGFVTLAHVMYFRLSPRITKYF